jgi:type IV fimbrial biogenesis protein FimT
MKNRHAGIRHSGYTLVEAGVVTAIVSILTAIGIPQYRDFMAVRSMQAHTSQLTNSFKLARTEALKRGAPVSVCLSVDGVSCETDVAMRDWSRGWLVFTDHEQRGVIDAGDSVLHVQAALERSGGILAAGSTLYVLTFLPTGGVAGAQNSFRFAVPPGISASLERRLCVASTSAWRITQAGAC